MSCHVLIFVLVGKDMKRGMLDGVIAPGFKNERKVKDHDLIIAGDSPIKGTVTQS
jgi:hypothetical protein